MFQKDGSTPCKKGQDIRYRRCCHWDDDLSLKDDDLGLKDDELGLKDENLGLKDENLGLKDDNLGLKDDDLGFKDGGLFWRMQWVHIFLQLPVNSIELDVKKSELLCKFYMINDMNLEI